MNKSVFVFKALLCIAVLAPPGLLRADCPDGTRPTKAEEQQLYMNQMSALKASLPMSLSGWQVSAPPLFTKAPSFVCKGSKLIAGYEATYTSLEQRKQNQEKDKQFEERIRAIRELPTDKQKEADDLYHQGSQLGYKSIAELKNKNQAEADRLRTEANKLCAASKAIRTAHMDAIAPQLRVITEEQRAAYVSPDVKVHLLVRDESGDPDTSGSERIQLAGIAKSYFTRDHALLILIGPVAQGHPVWVRLEGNREHVQSIARLFSGTRDSSLNTAKSEESSRQK